MSCPGVWLRQTRKEEADRISTPTAAVSLVPRRSEASPRGTDSTPAMSRKAALIRPTSTVSAPRVTA